jgi:hypothetical protein
MILTSEHVADRIGRHRCGGIRHLDQPVAALQQHRPGQQVSRAGLRVVERDHLAEQIVERANAAILAGDEQGVVLGRSLLPAAQEGSGTRFAAHLRDDERAVDVDVHLAAREPAGHLARVGHDRDLDVADAGLAEPRREILGQRPEGLDLLLDAAADAADHQGVASGRCLRIEAGGERKSRQGEGGNASRHREHDCALLKADAVETWRSLSLSY